MYKAIMVAAALALAPAGFLAMHVETARATASANSPQEFAMMAAQANLLEIESSRMALEMSKQDAVRAYAQKMIDDHTKAGKEMEQAASADKVVDVPKKLDAGHQAMLDALKGATGEDFDRAYAQMQLEAHEQAVQLFTRYSGQQGALAEFAKKTLPALQEHLDMARGLSGKA
jgi:putative membrane protein